MTTGSDKMFHSNRLSNCASVFVRDREWRWDGGGGDGEVASNSIGEGI
jgi:hypothetical protein